jgi:catechol 2,3-dioxygenase-like lactoylglutathione lyase family enzyme
MTAATRRSLARLWHLPGGTGWSQYVLTREGVVDAARIRLVVLDRPAAPWRTGWEPTVAGPYTIGFPTTDEDALDARLRALGFGARNPVERSPFTNPDGRSWEVLEALHTAPDFVAAVGLARGVGNEPLAPVDARGIGGPAYSMMVVEDLDRMVSFVREVLGYDVKIRRVQTSSGLKGSMRTPDGTQFELAHLAPRSARHGFLLLIQFRNLAVSVPHTPPRLPARGLTLYSFAVERLEPVLERAARAGATQITGPIRVDNPPNGDTRHATFLAPNGVMFELFETAPGR